MRTLELTKVIAELIEALQWCGGSSDFSPANEGGNPESAGKAHEGWIKRCSSAIKLGHDVLKAMNTEDQKMMIIVED